VYLRASSGACDLSVMGCDELGSGWELGSQAAISDRCDGFFSGAAGTRFRWWWGILGTTFPGRYNILWKNRRWLTCLLRESSTPSKLARIGLTAGGELDLR
jgi:hypothetical protein